MHIRASYSDAAGAVVDQRNSGDILTASASGVTKFTINNNGNIAATGTITGLTGITSSGSITFSGLSTDKGVLYTNGTGGLLAQTSQGASNTVLHGNGATAPSFSAVSLTADVTGVLPIANGGTNGTATPTAGAVAYGTGTAYAFSLAGSTGQCLVSGATGSPTWVDCGAAPTGYWQRNLGVLSPRNITDDLLIGGTATGSASFFQAFGSGTNAGSATMSGSLTIGNGGVIKPAHGPLALQYKSGVNAWTTGLTIQDTTGNVGIGDWNNDTTGAPG